MDLPNTISMNFPVPDDLLNFTVEIKPDEGYYRGGLFKFVFKVPKNYPHDPPKVVCTQRVFHPNIDTDGNICLNILREEWNPVLSILAVVTGLQFILLEPNADDPLNKDAAVILQSDKKAFAKKVMRTMSGGQIDGIKYDYVLDK